MKKEKQKGGKRPGAGRRPSEIRKEPVTIYTDVSRFGGKEGTRMAIYEFLAEGIENISKTGGVPLPADYVNFKKIGAVKSDGTIIKDITKPTNVLKPKEQPKTNFTINTLPEQKAAPLAALVLNNAEIEKKIAELENELKSPPKNPLIGERAWKRVREQKIQELKNQLK